MVSPNVLLAPGYQAAQPRTGVLMPCSGRRCGTGPGLRGTCPGTGAAAGRPGRGAGGEVPAGAPGWTGWAWRVSGPERSSAPQMTAPAAKMAAVHQNATV